MNYLRAICDVITRSPEFIEIEKKIADGQCPIAVGGLSGIHKAHIASALARRTGRPVFLVTPEETEARRLAADMSAISGETVRLLPARDFVFHNVDSASRQWEHERCDLFSRLMSGQPPMVCAPLEAVLQRTLPPDALRSVTLELRVGMTVPVSELLSKFVRCGFKRCEQVEGPGQFAARGGIVDFYSPADSCPVRVEFFGDEIDTISSIDVDTQRRTGQHKGKTVLPATETLPHACDGGTDTLFERMRGLVAGAGKKQKQSFSNNVEQDIARLSDGLSLPAADRYIALIYPEYATALDYLPNDTIFIIDEHARMREKAKNILWQYSQDVETLLDAGTMTGEQANYMRSADDFYRSAARFDVVMTDAFISAAYDIPPSAILSVSAKQLPSFGNSLETAITDIGHYTREGYSTVVLCPTERRARHLSTILSDNGVRAGLSLTLDEMPKHGDAFVTVGGLSAGMEYPSVRVAVITEGEVRQEPRIKRPRSQDKTNRQRVKSYADLSVGDLVVHEHHGIGRLAGIQKMEVDGVVRDYIKIAYSGADVLYVPASQLDMVSKYIGAGEDAPVRLNKLGGAEWARAKSRAKSAVKDLANYLVGLYAERQRRKGFAFPSDDEWQREFEEAFEYVETDDQLKCVSEIKKDMRQAIPMDRLLCGDVGFGKTEVALRAVMKCVLGGKQAAFLVPTTVLAQQHYVTATKRFANYPVKVDMVSRFRSPAQIRDTLKKFKTGQLDLIIGTHRLLQKDVVPYNLGLLIVDEEQRFGVSHKERLKEMSRQVDVLTLTATPIPRTLNMALSGIRDMSTIEEAPADRHPVQTYVLEHDWGLIADAIRRELTRGGQVYYLHNRVETIERTASKILEYVPEAAVAVAHGKMDEQQLGDVMRAMDEGEVNVLVCTTIIETGIDIPNVNTLIVEDADHLGLAQMHQIRGRVGRSPRHAYAYLTYRRGKVLTEIATKRLSAIREYAEFGSGFKIAMRDLEIRGAGNVLGAEQSGHMLSVGYDMYLKLLEEAVLEQRGEAPSGQSDCSADINVSAGIPEEYIPSPEQRMDIYRRIAKLTTRDDASDIIDELIDRYGDVPGQVNALVEIAMLRAHAARAGIRDIAQKSGKINFALTRLDVARVSLLCGMPEYKGRILLSAGEKPYIVLKLGSGENPLHASAKLIDLFSAEPQNAT